MKCLLFFVLISTACSAVACRSSVSPGPQKFKQDVEKADHIFLARATLIEDSCSVDGCPSGYGSVRVKFKIEATYKGHPEELEYIQTGYGLGDCGYPFRVGPRYLVFVRSNSTSINAGNIEHFSPTHPKFKAQFAEMVRILSGET